MSRISTEPKMMLRNTLGLRMARVAFNRSKHHKPMGAAMICGTHIVLAANESKSSPVTSSRWGYLEHQRGLHAEANLFSRATPGSYRGAKVFVYRERKDGSEGDSKPCYGCRLVLLAHQVKQVTYYHKGQWVTERLT